ncbi:MFS transporter [Chengkuizengella axinellae]|uniref:MFS transporter n=1 Tax=Chengkuizengella axinellae TaxID=3064388 RepID=A0ABT9J024_9BACL|nr:MFS transporter [Chengkuizengella sp. 2205SS18-9]MDP5274925.1 MFS transporter [Chengkuizengella sp. 2205SS18-9]
MITAKQNTAIQEKRESISIWMNKNFVILFITGSILAFGSKVYELALPLILYELTQSSVIMSTMRGIEFLPNLLLAMFIGVIVDRVNKKRWSLMAIVFQIIVLFMLFILIQFGNHNLILFYISGFMLMTCSYAYYNAQASIVKQVLPTQLLTSANASFSFVHKFVGIMGPAITGFILLLSDLHYGLLITSTAFSFAFFLLLFLDSKELVKKRKSNFWEDLKAGWKELRRNKPLWLITILVIFSNSTIGMVDTMVIFFAKDELKLDSSQLGIVLSCAGIGGLVGSSIVSYIRKKFSLGFILGVSTLLTGLAYFVLFMTENIWLLGVGLFLEGLFGIIGTICIWSYRQETTPQQFIGRISGITGSIFKLGMPFAIFASGWIAEWYDPSTVFLLAFILNIFIFIWVRKSPLWKVA